MLFIGDHRSGSRFIMLPVLRHERPILGAYYVEKRVL